MPNNYIFTGFGYSTGDYEITNNELYKAVQEGQITGFNEELILESQNYRDFLENHPDSTTFDYFVGFKMGFHKRHHVSPLPPTPEHQRISPTSLDLSVEAVEMALNDANLTPEQIDCWIVSTVSPHEVAPGIAATLKCYFAKPENRAPATTLTSGCAGFNVGICRAINYLKSNQSAKNIIVLHTETMSHFLTEKSDFVSFSTFGDAAAAVIVTRSEKEFHEGVICESNYHDSLMVDSVGVDIDRNLYMDGNWVKQRAVINISDVSREVLNKSGWSLDMIDMVVPHQTGNIILHSVANELGISIDKLFLDAQKEYGNVSSATIPVALSMLRYKNALKPGMRILCPTAGVGGEYGAFSYIVPEPVTVKKQIYLPLKDKNALVLFADSKMGFEICNNLIENGCQVLAHCYETNEFTSKIQDLKRDGKNIEMCIKKLESFLDVENTVIQDFGNKHWNYHLNLISVNELFYSTAPNKDKMLKLNEIICHLTRKLLYHTKETIFILGHPIELTNNQLTSPFKEFLTGWHGLAGSMSGEAISKGIRTVWYIPGIFNETTSNLNNTLKNACKNAMRQEKYKNDLSTVKNVVKSLYLLKVPNTLDIRKGQLINRTEQFAFRKK